MIITAIAKWLHAHALSPTLRTPTPLPSRTRTPCPLTPPFGLSQAFCLHRHVQSCYLPPKHLDGACISLPQSVIEFSSSARNASIARSVSPSSSSSSSSSLPPTTLLRHEHACVHRHLKTRAYRAPGYSRTLGGVRSCSGINAQGPGANKGTVYGLRCVCGRGLNRVQTQCPRAGFLSLFAAVEMSQNDSDAETYIARGPSSAKPALQCGTGTVQRMRYAVASVISKSNLCP